ncbi:MAG: FAD-binding dehydrogenase [Oceanospirillaceae bacterium]|nr:FAD-binding dehydrogenase [Oceanospirillaceae bacterium]
MQQYQADVVVIGAGIAGLSATLELLNAGKSVIVCDAQTQIGGMAKEAFGGMHLINTPQQRWNGIRDDADLALQDWLSFAEFSREDVWPRKWAHHYLEYCRRDIYDWLNKLGVHFFPVVHWVERGNYGCGGPGRGNSLPRYHMVWGTGEFLMQRLQQAISVHPQNKKLRLLLGHKITDFICQQQSVQAVRGKSAQGEFCVQAPHTIIAGGGINGNPALVRQHWDTACYGEYPQNMLQGAHPSADGHLHTAAAVCDAQINHLGWMWNYAAGISHPQPTYTHEGLSLIPARSSLWLDASGQRIGPLPLMTGFDTHDLCKITGHLPGQYSWQIMNRRIADKELAVSGAQMNPAFRQRSWLGILKIALRGNPALVDYLIEHCPDVICAESLPELAQAMNHYNGDQQVQLANMQRDIGAYDRQCHLYNSPFVTDDQLRRIQLLRRWRGDKARTLAGQAILDKNAGPLIAIKSRLISRKSMGGFCTDLSSQVFNRQGQVIPGLYAAGEAAGFGGGGIAGKRSLEGTFLSACILTARRAAQHIVQQA